MNVYDVQVIVKVDDETKASQATVLANDICEAIEKVKEQAKVEIIDIVAVQKNLNVIA